jgi:hypothetical protein
MKKLFALALIAGSLSFFACNNDNNEANENHEDTTTVTTPPAQEPMTTPDTNAAPMDTTMKDTTKKM